MTERDFYVLPAWCVAVLVTWSVSSIADGAIATWTGASSPDVNWSTAHNWLNDSPPTTAGGDTVAFDSNSTQNLATVNDIAGLSLNGIKIADPTGDVSISGNGFTLSGGLDGSAATQNLFLSLAAGQSIALGASQTWSVNSGRVFHVESPITGNAGANLQFGSTTSPSGLSGSFWITAPNTIAGNTILGGPNITHFLRSSTPLGTGTLNFNSFNSAPILMSMGEGGHGGVAFNNPITLQSGFVLGDATTGDLTLNGEIKFTGDIAGQANRTINNMSAYFVVINGNVTLGDPGITPAVHNRTLTLSNVLGSGTLIYGVIKDPTSATNMDIGSLTKNGTGSAGLYNLNTYSGPTNIQNGLLIATYLADQGQPSSLGTGAAGATITLGSGTTTGVLRYIGTQNASTNRQLQLPGTSGGGVLISEGSGTVSFTAPTFGTPGAGDKTLTLRGPNMGANTVAGVIANQSAANTTAVTKEDSGTWVLTGANTYGGGTQVLFGSLRLNNTTGSGTGSGLVTVSNAGKLGGIGSVGGATSVSSGGFITPGTPETNSGIGTFTINNSLTLASGSILSFDLGAAGNDLINITNTVTLPISGTVTVNLTNQGGLTGGSPIALIDYTGTLGGSFSTLVLGAKPAGFTYVLINNTANTSIDLLVTAVPEPSALALAALGLIGMVRHGRSRTAA